MHTILKIISLFFANNWQYILLAVQIILFIIFFKVFKALIKTIWFNLFLVYKYINLICGDIGGGKTSLATLFGIRSINERDIHIPFFHHTSRVTKSKRHIARQNAGGNNFTPSDCVTFSDYAFSNYKRGFKFKQAHSVDDFSIGIGDNPQNYPVSYFPPYSTLICDEGIKFVDSRLSSGNPEFVFQWFNTLRHNEYRLFLIMLRIESCDVIIRKDTDKILFVKKCKHFHFPWAKQSKDTEFKEPFFSYWVVNEYDKIEDAVAQREPHGTFISLILKAFTKRGNVRRRIFFHFGNIFNNYNTHNNQPYFYRGIEDFTYNRLSVLQYTKYSFEKSNKKIRIFRPVNYAKWKPKSISKEKKEEN